jgi:hypothetical protein
MERYIVVPTLTRPRLLGGMVMDSYTAGVKDNLLAHIGENLSFSPEQGVEP